MSGIKNRILLLLIISMITGCREPKVPRPRGYFRVDLPEHNYILFSGSDSAGYSLPLSFEYPEYGKMSFASDSYSEPGWFNIDFNRFNARLYLTYRKVNSDLEVLMEQTYKMNVTNHIPKADAINELLIRDPLRNINGILYDLKGNTATAVQFFVTDSTKHFFRGSLYFFTEPNPDSIEPVLGFLREDIIHLIETLKWDYE